MSHAVGPLLVLTGEALSIASLCVWGINVGDGACAWRVPYSPRSGAFRIWSIIYSTTVVLCILQLAKVVPTFDIVASTLWAVAWLLCAVWVPLFDASSPTSLIMASVAIGTAAATATAAAWRAEAWLWVGDSTRPRGVLGLPLSLLAGWLLAASSIAAGVAIKANAPNAQSTCVLVPRVPGETERAYQRRRRRRYREAFEATPVEESFVPVPLAVGAATLAVLARDPILTLPVAWALVYQRTFPGVVTVGAIALCACGSAGALVHVFRF